MTHPHFMDTTLHQAVLGRTKFQTGNEASQGGTVSCANHSKSQDTERDPMSPTCPEQVTAIRQVVRVRRLLKKEEVEKELHSIA